MTEIETTEPAASTRVSRTRQLLAKWSLMSFGGKFVTFIVVGNLIAGAIALTAVTLRTFGLIPPSAPYVAVEQPKYDKRACWRRHVERVYGDAVALEELRDDLQLQIRLQCDPNAAIFDGQ